MVSWKNQNESTAHRNNCTLHYLQHTPNVNFFRVARWNLRVNLEYQSFQCVAVYLKSRPTSTWVSFCLRRVISVFVFTGLMFCICIVKYRYLKNLLKHSNKVLPLPLISWAPFGGSPSGELQGTRWHVEVYKYTICSLIDVIVHLITSDSLPLLDILPDTSLHQMDTWGELKVWRKCSCLSAALIMDIVCAVMATREDVHAWRDSDGRTRQTRRGLDFDHARERHVFFVVVFFFVAFFSCVLVWLFFGLSQGS